MRNIIIRYILLCMCIICLLTALLGCSESTRSFDDKVKVIYHLEGGVYQNCEQPVVQYYGFEGDGGHLIVDLTTLSGQNIIRSGYTLEGWYTKKIGEGDSVTYEDKWDFATDKVTSSGVTLYAKWKKDILYTYEICYRDEIDQSVHSLGSYEVSEGDTFNKYYATYFSGKRYGYTVLNGIYDENGEPWDESFTHPGGETDTAIQVFLHYIEGEYVLVDSPRQLLANKTKNLYLTGDIDFEGEDFSGFGDYSGIIKGNGYTVKNFNLSYDNSKNGLITDADLNTEGGLLCIGLFGSLKGASITDISFTDFTVDIKAGYPGTKMILVTPLAMKIANSTLTNVRVDGATVTCTQLPSGFDKTSSLIVLTDKPVYFIPSGDGSTITDVAVSLVDKTEEN